MLKADIYIRVSTDEQADKGYSQRNQEEVLRRYCEFKGITIRKVVYEDHSAKTFKRPEWQELLKEYKKRRGIVDLVLFTKWDRFSRNAPDAYQMIGALKNLAIEPQAVEQPLDMSVPENKMMLAIYLTSGEVENDRRALNVFFGMRRAKKEGRWMGTAPIGYINKINESGRKYIAIDPEQGNIMKWAFERLAEGKLNTWQVWNEARKKGLRTTKNNFWVAIRNPLYCGKIFIPQFKEEAARFVKGLHEPLITEGKFNEVQEVLNGRARKKSTTIRTKVVSDSELPLRGFLGCPKCDRMLTGSASKGRNGYYHYYHCSSACGYRKTAKEINVRFSEVMSSYLPDPAMSTLFKQVIKDENKNYTSLLERDKRQFIAQIDEHSARLSKARILMVDGKIDPSDFKIIKTESEASIEKLEAQVLDYTANLKNITEIIEKAGNALSNLGKLYQEGDVAVKREIIGSFFPEKLYFEDDAFRTERMNEGVMFIYQIISKLEGQKKKGQAILKFACPIW